MLPYADKASLISVEAGKVDELADDLEIAQLFRCAAVAEIGAEGGRVNLGPEFANDRSQLEQAVALPILDSEGRCVLFFGQTVHYHRA